jgi:hypothetical protein
MPFVLYYAAQTSPPVIVEDAVANGTVSFEVEHTGVFASGDCVQVRWSVEGIREVYLAGTPTIGSGDQELCVNPNSAFLVIVLRVLFQNDTVKNYPVLVDTYLPALLLTSLPLLLVSLYCSPLLTRLPATNLEGITRLFADNHRVNGLLIIIFVAVQLVVLANAIRHSPAMNYDAVPHFKYVDAIKDGRLPSAEDSLEFFSPPLPYLLPALAARLNPYCPSLDGESCSSPFPRKMGQLQNVALSIATCLFLLAICEQLCPQDSLLKITSLGLLGMLPVYYKTFAMMRGEPFVIMFALWTIYRLLVMLRAERQVRVWDSLWLGIPLAGLILSRQWGALIWIAVALWAIVVFLQRRHAAWRLIRVGALAFVIGIVFGGWFYLSLTLRFGSPLAFNREVGNETQGQPLTWELGNPFLFSTPFILSEPNRISFANQAFPKFYTEIWGDYEGFFFLNYRAPMPDYLVAYLGRVNFVSLLPFAVLAIGVLFGIWQSVRWLGGDKEQVGWALCAVCIVVSLGGYLWFLIRYPSYYADTVKATYMLQIFPFAAILTAHILQKLRDRSNFGYRVLVALLVLVFIHNLPLLFTRNTSL